MWQTICRTSDHPVLELLNRYSLIESSHYNSLTHWGRDKMAAIFQTTSSNAFSWMKMYEFRLKFHWSLFLRVQLTIFQYWFRWWLGAEQATSHYLNQWWPSSTTHVCVTRPRWVNSSPLDWTGDKPLSEPMMTQFNDACMRHSASMSWLISPRLNRRQAIIWTNDDPVQRRMYASLGLDELTHLP